MPLSFFISAARNRPDNPAVLPLEPDCNQDSRPAKSRTLLPKYLVAALFAIWFSPLAISADSVRFEVLGGAGEGTGPALRELAENDYGLYLLSDFENTTDPRIREIQLYQFFRGYEPQIKSTSWRMSIMYGAGDFIELGTSVQSGTFQAENLYPDDLTPLVPFYASSSFASFPTNPLQELARTDATAALFLYDQRGTRSFSPAYFFSADIRLVLPMGPFALYVTGSLPFTRDSGNGRSAFAGGFRVDIPIGLSLYLEGHRSYSQISLNQSDGRSYSAVVHDTGARFGFAVFM
jgi:hypothetical protein